MTLPPARGLAAALRLYLLALPVAAARLDAPGRGWRVAAMVLMGLAAAAAIRRDLLRQGPGAIQSLSWPEQGGFRLKLGSGHVEPARLGAGSVRVGPWLWLVLYGRRRYALFVDLRRLDGTAAAALARHLR